VIGLAPNAAGVIGGILTGTGAAEASGNSPTLTLVIALLGGGIGVSLMNAIIRRRTGEDRADAADALSTGAQQLAHGAQQLIAPLNQQIIELTKKNAELESKLGAARRETADRAIEAADMQREILRIQGERDQQHNLDRAEVHEAVAKAAEASVDLANAKAEIEKLRDELDTLQVQAGHAGDRRSSS
jgi:uncharacterized membrane protein YgaE (UPF0421/DUF939 family)